MDTHNKNTSSRQSLTELLKNATKMSHYLALLKALSSEYLILFAVKDTPGRKMPASIIQQIHELGFSKFQQKLWLMYAGAIYKSDMLLNKSGDKPELSVSYECDVNDCHITINSASFRKENHASILINGNDYSINRRGINIVVYDVENHELIDSIAFDSFETPNGKFYRRTQAGSYKLVNNETQNKNTANLQVLIDLLKNTTEAFYYLALLQALSSEYLILFAIKDTPGRKMPPSMIRQIKELGFSSFEQRMWLMYAGIMYKSEVLLNQSGGKPGNPIFHECDVNGCHIEISSSSYKQGNRASITINGNDYCLNRRGVNIVVYDVENHEMIDSIAFDSFATPYGKFYRRTQQRTYKRIDIETAVVQISDKIDALSKTVDVNNHKMNYVFWNFARTEGETSLDARKRFFKTLQTEDRDMLISQKTSTIILSELGRICEQNNIDYWLAFGTLLGAVRHNNFVPWDDDVDICMIRKDIPRLQKAISEADTCIRIYNFFMIDTEPHRVNNIYRVGFKDLDLKQFVDIYIYDNCDNYSDERWKKYREDRKSYISQLIQFCPIPSDEPNLNYWEKRAVTNQEHINTILSVTNKFQEDNSTENGDFIIWRFDNTSYLPNRKGIFKSSDIFL